jgi:formate--tetrahydrofolate ligase
MLTDIEISQNAKVEKITKIADKLNIEEEYLELYGFDKAKINLNIFKKYANKPDGKLILVTAINPTPLGEGKSTTSIGLVDAMCQLNKKALGALREPSLGPVFGVKGGAAGGGYAQINPMADLNLHFTGDLHAITSANNLISACLDNHIYQGNELNINPERIVWQRCMDLNDRALREVVVAKEAKKEDEGRKESFNITVASEIMAILCLAKDMEDLRSRVDNLILAYTFDDKVITVKDLGITGSVLVLLKDALKPNLVQTLENNPILVHGGPFANIAHGCNSIMATRLGLKLSDYLITEAGFGADLGAEKFLDIKCREAGLKPSAVVLVATIKALKYHGGVDAKECKLPNLDALKQGIVNLEKHIDTLNKFKLPFVIALNRFDTDTIEELEWIDQWAKENNYPLALSEVFAKGGQGGIELAKKVIETCEKPNDFTYLYDLNDEVEDKIFKIASKVYGANKVVYKKAAMEKLEEIKKTNYKDFYICMAKTPLSLTDNAKMVGAPKDFTITVKEIRVSAGAKFLVCLTGAVMTMPGLPKEPLAKKIDIDSDYTIHNLS